MTFKVGDRVRFVEDNPMSGPRYGAKGDVRTVTFVNGETVDLEPWGDLGFEPSAPIASLEIVPDEGPVRTVTRHEIIPGTYDGVEVGSEVTGRPQREVMVRIATDHGPMVCMTADELDRAAAVLTALAGALRDGE